MTTDRLKERGAEPLTLTPSPGDPHLPGVAEWMAAQKRKAAADLLRRELESLNPEPKTSLF